MDWRHVCYASIDCVVMFQISNESVLVWKTNSTVPKDRFISYLKARKLVYKEYVYHLVRINNSSIEIPLIQSVPVVKKFPKVFSDDHLEVPPKRDRL